MRDYRLFFFCMANLMAVRRIFDISAALFFRTICRNVFWKELPYPDIMTKITCVILIESQKCIR